MYPLFSPAFFLRHFHQWWRLGPHGYRLQGIVISETLGLQIIHARLLSVALQTAAPDKTPVFTTFEGKKYRLTNDSIWPVPC